MPDVSDPTPEPLTPPLVPGTPEPRREEPSSTDEVDLAAIESDLAAVEVALARLAEGTYWTDEITGRPLPDDVLADDPTARRA